MGAAGASVVLAGLAVGDDADMVKVSEAWGAGVDGIEEANA